MTIPPPMSKTEAPDPAMADSPPKRSRVITWLLIGLPLWLVVSGGSALWYYFHQQENEAQIESARFARTVSTKMLADDLNKIVNVIGERNGSSETAAKNLSRTASMIEGLLGPSNTGYDVRREEGPADWPLLHVTLKGKSPDAATVWVITSYDSKPGSPGVESNATGLAATLAAAQALAGDTTDLNVCFVLLPHANDPESPLLETSAKLLGLTESKGLVKTMLYIESMGAGESLWLSSRDADSPALALNHGLGQVHGADVICLNDDLDFSSILFETGLPAVRVATRNQILPDDPDDAPPAAAVVAASAGRLVELIRRCAHL